MPDDMSKKAATLVSIITDPTTWETWIIKNPARMAQLLGTCSEGETFIAEAVAPFISKILGLTDKTTTHTTIPSNSKNKRRYTMPNGKETTTSSETGEAVKEGIVLAGKLLELLQIGLKSKKKSDKLRALVIAWEQTGLYKDLLISVYENGKVSNPQQKKKTQEIRKKLLEIQQLLRDIREKIDKDADYSNESKQLDKLLREVIDMLVNL